MVPILYHFYKKFQVTNLAMIIWLIKDNTLVYIYTTCQYRKDRYLCNNQKYEWLPNLLDLLAIKDFLGPEIV